jgi:hypothetical protein
MAAGSLATSTGDNFEATAMTAALAVTLWMAERRDMLVCMDIFYSPMTFGSRIPQKAALPKPFVESVKPFGHRSGIAGPQTKTMPHSCVDMQFSGHLGLFELEIDFRQSLGNVRSVITSAGQKDGRRICVWLNPA